ncbi:chromosome transmission fidelity protein 8 homolog [Macrosteles quadrilineatus]|uniref:chromosome transmission fidelity protein 8 homolog n=1 Tax=Macrosteles quadrilineatus TaxID=74068 RepID=UPI0023E09832|nr:chromosome transmission fidelity protein 8 homolog [Macrosteles quadrilineatus]
MTILVKMQEEPPQWGVIELQGDVESRYQTAVEDQFVGDLHFTIQGNTPVLIIGHHILYGKAVTLEKPFAVLEKSSDSNSTEYIVKALVKQKLLFKTRPKPIIANVPKIL